eukprot:2062493-Prymnesium_polylepis.1
MVDRFSYFFAGAELLEDLDAPLLLLGRRRNDPAVPPVLLLGRVLGSRGQLFDDYTTDALHHKVDGAPRLAHVHDVIRAQVDLSLEARHDVVNHHGGDVAEERHRLNHRAVGEHVDLVRERGAQLAQRLVRQVKVAVVRPHVVIIHRAPIEQLDGQLAPAQLRANLRHLGVVDHLLGVEGRKVNREFGD